LILETIFLSIRLLNYKLILFDFDGTLADSFPLFLSATAEALERLGLRSLDFDKFEELRSRSAREVIAYLGIPFWKVPTMMRLVRGRMTECAESIQLFPGIEHLLTQLAEAGVILSIVSSNSEANVRKILGEENSRLISVYECGASLFGKASRFRRVLKRTGVARADAICIGDEIRDIEAAQAEGIPFGAVTWGYTSAEGLQRFSPSMLFHNTAAIYGEVVTQGNVAT
jgi:phosphoglycolate phosphatase